MHKRFLAAVCAAGFLFGMPASAEYIFQAPVLATHPLQLDYIGVGQCIATNPGNIPVATNLTIINTETQTAVAWNSFVVPPKGQAVLSYQSFSAIDQNHICKATMGFNKTSPNWVCDNGEATSLVIGRGFLGIPDLLVQFRDNEYTSNGAHQNAVMRIMNKGICVR